MNRWTSFSMAALPVLGALAAASCANGVTTLNPHGSSGAGAGGGSAPVIECGKEKLCGKVCVDVQSDPQHCGDCGAACGAGKACTAGKCTLNCGSTLATCADQCIDLQNDPAHCGACDKACPAAMGADPLCLAGQCSTACQPGLADCDAMAMNGCEVDLSKDPKHCAKCDTACPSVAHGTPGCAKGKCGIGSCDPGYDDCNKDPSDGCEINLNKDPKNCSKCAMGCNQATMEQCQNGTCTFVPFNFNILQKKDIVYQGINYLLLQVSYKSNVAAGATWCDDYMNMCLAFGYVPTGCGKQFTNQNNGYGNCKTQYQSDGTSDTLGCNPSGGVANAAQQNGFGGANSFNSFGFHYCDAGSCTKTMCSGQYCSSSLSYFDTSQPVGYTLCKKP